MPQDLTIKSPYNERQAYNVSRFLAMGSHQGSAMNRAYLLAALLAVSCTPAPAFAQSGPESMQANIRGMTITIYSDPCPESVLAIILPEYQDGFRRATVKERDKTFAACWKIMDGEVVIVDELGNAGGTAKEAYKVPDGV